MISLPFFMEKIMPSFIVNPKVENKGATSIPGALNVQKYYFSPGKEGKGIIVRLNKILSKELLENTIIGVLRYSVIVVNNGKEIYSSGEKSFDFSNENSFDFLPIINNALNTDFGVVEMKSGKAQIIYNVYIEEYIYYTQTANLEITYDLYITENTEPLPKWNAWTVCERMLNIAETIMQGDKPRFKLDKDQEAWLRSIETPEFQFTQSTLRECLQGVGRLFTQSRDYYLMKITTVIKA